MGTLQPDRGTALTPRQRSSPLGVSGFPVEKFGYRRRRFHCLTLLKSSFVWGCQDISCQLPHKRARRSPKTHSLISSMSRFLRSATGFSFLCNGLNVSKPVYRMRMILMQYSPLWNQAHRTSSLVADMALKYPCSARYLECLILIFPSMCRKSLFRHSICLPSSFRSLPSIPYIAVLPIPPSRDNTVVRCE